jgi:hypothetical protein
VTAATLLAAIPALPLHTAGKYVAGAYVVLFALVLIYVAIMAIRLSRIERELGDLLSLAASISDDDASSKGERDETPAAARPTATATSAAEREGTPA